MTESELIAKYDVPGPRYTSYPTVPYWENSPKEEEWFAHLSKALASARSHRLGAAVYMHVPFCRSLCHYCGCNTVITRNTQVSDPYVDRLLTEWRLYTQRLGKISLSELHLGGGTPTFLSASQLQRLMRGFLSEVILVPGFELGLEADPRVTSKEQLQVLAELGFSRLSLGIQDFDATVQAAVNRHQSVDEVRQVTENARELGFRSINYDLIYGLPKQTEASVLETVDVVRQLRPDRIAFYGYAHVPWMKGVQRKFQDADVPLGPAKRRLYELGRSLLLSSGYLEIGMDHFALEGDGLWKAYQQGRMHRNFMGYTERSTMPLFALGVSAIGDTWTAYAQNEKNVDDWAKAIDAGRLPIQRGHVLTEEDLLLRRHIVELMTRFETAWQPTLWPSVAETRDALAELASDGLVDVSDERVAITEKGRPFVRNVCMAFDARLLRKAPTKPLFSRTV